MSQNMNDRSIKQSRTLSNTNTTTTAHEQLLLMPILLLLLLFPHQSQAEQPSPLLLLLNTATIDFYSNISIETIHIQAFRKQFLTLNIRILSVLIQKVIFLCEFTSILISILLFLIIPILSIEIAHKYFSFRPFQAGPTQYLPDFVFQVFQTFQVLCTRSCTSCTPSPLHLDPAHQPLVERNRADPFEGHRRSKARPELDPKELENNAIFYDISRGKPVKFASFS